MASAGQPYAVSDVWFKTLVKFDDINPENTVPVLIADGQRVAGSGDILAWLDAARPDAGLYPQGAAEWEAWADEVVGPWARRVAYRTIYARPSHYTRNPGLWALFRASRSLVLNILKHAKARRFDARDADDGPKLLDRISEQLGDTGTGYLFGARPSAADFATAALLEPALRIRREPICTHPAWAELHAYVARVKPRRMPARRRIKWNPAQRATWAALPLASVPKTVPA